MACTPGLFIDGSMVYHPVAWPPGLVARPSSAQPSPLQKRRTANLTPQQCFVPQYLGIRRYSWSVSGVVVVVVVVLVAYRLECRGLGPQLLCCPYLQIPPASVP